MNAVDTGILVVVGLFAVGGLRRGFLLGLVDLLVFGLSLVVGARLGGSVAAPLSERGIPDELAAGAGFIIAAVVSLAVIGLAVRVILAPLGALGAGTPLGWANGVLGILPGAVRGLAAAALLVLLVSALPPELGLRDPLAESRLAAPIAETGREALDAGLSWAGIDPRTLGIPYQTPSSGTIDLPFSGITALESDGEAEQTLLALINQELAAAGLDYPLSGENIALAPAAALAHEGLMNSPAHRANILNPGFTRVGIAALRDVEHGLMVTQEFAGP